VTVAIASLSARAVDRWLSFEAGVPLLLILGSALTAPLLAVGSLTLTGDRMLGLGAVAVTIGLVLRRRLHWTPIHSALVVFVGVQLVTTALNATAWPRGLRFVTVYGLGFACFCVAAECARSVDGRRRFTACWIAVGAAIGVVGTVVAMWANLSQQLVWGTGIAQALFFDPEKPRLVFACKVTFGEWNLLSSFLLVPFALGLWLWRRESDAGPGPWRLLAPLAALVLGLSFGFTRAAWLATGGIIALWWWATRPRRPQLAALASILALAFLLELAAVGIEPFESRVVGPITTGVDWNVAGRIAISRATIASWLTRPVLGHGAGSITRLSVVLPDGRRIDKIWNGNLVLFVLHDSGVLGLAALAGFGVAVWRRGARAVARGGDGAGPNLAAPLLVVGGALCFAYQFTHALWLMYPYVYLGLLTAATDDGAPRA
jgi:O-antigen ligase